MIFPPSLRIPEYVQLPVLSIGERCEQNMTKLRNFYRILLLFWCFFIGIGALSGSLCMFLDPSGITFGMDGFLPAFTKLPFASLLFSNLIFPGIALLIVNGITQFGAAFLLLRRHPAGAKMGILCGALLMAWICIQFVIFPFNFLSTAYFIFGLLELCTGILLLHAEKSLCAA